MRVFLALIGFVLASGSVAAQDVSRPEPPPPPAAPEVVTRNASGDAAIRATRLTTPIVLDGRLDEEVYNTTRHISDFIQQEPLEGRPASERTDVWVFFDDQHVYITARNWESEPGRRVMTDMQRDSRNLYNNDHFAVLFDTFFDRRNGYYFYANAQGGLSDGQLGNESPNNNWNGIWEARTADFEGGWIAEFRFPFRSMRFDEDGTTWGINFRRVVRWKNEFSFLTPIPQSLGRRGLTSVSRAGTLVGLTPPRGLRNLDVKPYATASRLTNRLADPPIAGRGVGDIGGDIKWGLSPNVVVDLTMNTDFAQVEDDEAQVNLTRFSVFFPEKREFFLEGQDYFSFGNSGGGGGFGGGGGGGGGGFGGNAPVLFYSRRIGIAEGQQVPIVVGSRFQGRSAGFQVGALHVRTGTSDVVETHPTDYSVLRVSRDLLSRSRIGVIATRRGVPALGEDVTSYAYGADLALNLTTEFSASGYWARTQERSVTPRDASSYQARAGYSSDRYALEGDYLYVGDDFDPAVGFLRRRAYKRTNAEGRFSPRPASLPGVRKVFFESEFDQYATTTGSLESRAITGTFRLELNNTERLSVEVSEATEHLVETTNLGADIPAGRYRFRQTQLNYELSPSRRLSGFLSVTHGGFFGGTITEASWRGRVAFSSRLYAEPSLSFNRVRTPFGDEDSHVLGSRMTFTLSPRMFISSLVQYRTSSRSMTTNARFRWEYQPGSEIFVVYSDGRSGDTTSRVPRTLDTRALVVKVTRLFRW